MTAVSTAAQPVLDEIRVWQRIRRYAVPKPMIAACTAAREAGDWRAACAAARIDIGFDLAEVAREHGRAQAELIEADLAVLAPDLLRWHLPRTLGGRTSLATHQEFLLSVREDRFGDGDAALVLRAPKTVDGSQRLRLAVRPAIEKDDGRHDLPPAFWSSAHVGGLVAAYGGSAARLPGFEADGTVRPFDAYPTSPDPGDPASRAEAFDRHAAVGDLVGAWAAAGVDFDPAPVRTWGSEQASELVVAGQVIPVGLGTELARLHARYGVSTVVIGQRWRLIAGIERRRNGTLGAGFLEYDQKHLQRPRIVAPVYLRPADLELVRHGLLDRTELHPLVRAALFPHAPAEPAAPAAPVGGGSHPDLRVAAPVRCQGAWHTVVHADGRLNVNSHTAEEVARERMLRALGGRVSGCFAAVEAWHGSDDRLPRPLRGLRRDVLQRIQHGGSAALTELLDAGLDPRMRDGRGGTLLHHLRAMDDVALIRRILDAGVPVNAANRRRRTALHVAIGDGGTPEMVTALLEAGADPQAQDDNGNSAVELATYKSHMYRAYDEDEDDADEEAGGSARDRWPAIRIRQMVEAWVEK